MPFLLVFLSTILVIILFYQFSLKIKLVDCPSNRKLHQGRASLIGGPAIFLSVMFGIFMFGDLDTLRYFVVCSIIMFIVGIMDEYELVPYQIRLSFHILIGLIITLAAGISIETLGGITGEDNLFLYGWSVPFTIIAVSGVINAVNFSDGIDGMAASISLITLCSIVFLIIIAGEDFSSKSQLSLFFIASLLAFLPINIGLGVYSKKIFMGNSGTLFIGLGLAWSLIELSQGGQRVFAPVTALWIFSIPLMDTISIIFRRIINGRSPFNPDREHLHHFFQSLGYSDRKALLIIIAMSVVMASIGIWSEYSDISEWKMFALFIFIFVLYLLGVMYAWRLKRLIKKM